MSISASIRARRIAFKNNSPVRLILEGTTGERHEVAVKNGSLTGLGGITKSDASSFQLGELVPESKLVWEENEVALGRLTVKSIRITREGTFVGFSCIDGRMPLIGSLSKHYKTDSLSNPFEYELSAKKISIVSFVADISNHRDLFQRCFDFKLLWDDLKNNNFGHFYSVRHSQNQKNFTVSFKDKKNKNQYVSFATYDYFGLANDPEMKEAAIKAIKEVGLGAMGSPPLSGKTTQHENLENYLSSSLGKEDCIVFPSGYAANVGTLTALLSTEDLALADLFSHASIVDGLNASKSKLRYFRHNNLAHLEALLKEHRDNHAGTLLITEGVFSMDGDLPDLKEFCTLANQYNARTFIDEAHSFGIFGQNGLGASEKYNVLDNIDIYTGSLSKGVGAMGGFVTGSKDLINWLRIFARSSLFSSALPPASAAAALTGVKKILNEQHRRDKLRENIKLFREGLESIGYMPVSDPESPIIPVIVGQEEMLGKINAALVEMNVLVNPIVYPAVPNGQARLRFSMSSDHSPSEIQMAINALKLAFEKNGFKQN